MPYDISRKQMSSNRGRTVSLVKYGLEVWFTLFKHQRHRLVHAPLCTVRHFV